MSLGWLEEGHLRSSANLVSADGKSVYGESGGETGDSLFVWQEGRGMRGLRQVLESDHKLADAMNEWYLSEVVGVSADGIRIVGNGRNPDGTEEGWIAVLADGPATVDPDLSISKERELSWTRGVLQYSKELHGPWTDMPAASPFRLLPIGCKGFLRVNLKGSVPESCTN